MSLKFENIQLKDMEIEKREQDFHLTLTELQQKEIKTALSKKIKQFNLKWPTMDLHYLYNIKKIFKEKDDAYNGKIKAYYLTEKKNLNKKIGIINEEIYKEFSEKYRKIKSKRSKKPETKTEDPIEIDTSDSSDIIVPRKKKSRKHGDKITKLYESLCPPDLFQKILNTGYSAEELKHLKDFDQLKNWTKRNILLFQSIRNIIYETK